MFYNLVAQRSLKSSQANNPFTLFPAFVLYSFSLLNKAFQERKWRSCFMFYSSCMGKWVADLFFYSSDIDPPGFFLSPWLCSAVSFLNSSKNCLPLLNFQASQTGVGVKMHLFRRSQCLRSALQNRTQKTELLLLPVIEYPDMCG